MQNHYNIHTRTKTFGFMCIHTSYFLPLHCLHADWDRDQPSLPFKSHKTINLTSTDHPILLGSPDANTANSSLDFTSRISTETPPSKEAPGNPVIVSDPESYRLTQVWSVFSPSLFPVQRVFNEQAPCHVSLQDVASNGVNGSFRQEPVTMRNKGKEQCVQSERLWNWSWWLFLYSI